MKFSIVIPVYNRPDEIDELMSSLTRQTFRDFEVIVVDDGSTIKCDRVIDKYLSQLNIKFFVKKTRAPDHPVITEPRGAVEIIYCSSIRTASSLPDIWKK